MFLDVWDNLSHGRSLYGKGDLRLSSVGKARLGRVLRNKKLISAVWPVQTAFSG